jgi:hypothetical protein
LGLFDYYDPKYDWQPGTEIALCNRIQRTARPETKLVEEKYEFLVFNKFFYLSYILIFNPRIEYLGPFYSN